MILRGKPDYNYSELLIFDDAHNIMFENVLKAMGAEIGEEFKPYVHYRQDKTIKAWCNSPERKAGDSTQFSLGNGLTLTVKYGDDGPDNLMVEVWHVNGEQADFYMRLSPLEDANDILEFDSLVDVKEAQLFGEQGSITFFSNDATFKGALCNYNLDLVMIKGKPKLLIRKTVKPVNRNTAYGPHDRAISVDERDYIMSSTIGTGDKI